MPTYLVTGGCGFIGSNFVHYLLKREPDSDVIVVDNLGFAASKSNLASAEARVQLEVADIADPAAMSQIYSTYRPDYVVNFAAESHNDRAIRAPSAFARSNAMGAQVMLECSRVAEVRRHLHVSTIEVYGELPTSAAFFNEASPLNAKTPYSASKAAGDQLVRAYMHTYPEMDIVMTHCANNYGPYQLPEKLLPLAITNVLRGRKIPIYGDGLQKRDWLHVDDHCGAILDLLMADLPPIPAEAVTDPSLLPIFDISARHELTNLQIVLDVLGVLNEEPERWIEHVGDRPNHDRRYLIDPSKLEAQLGWRPSIDFTVGIRETVEWYARNRNWWEDLLQQKGELQTTWS